MDILPSVVGGIIFSSIITCGIGPLLMPIIISPRDIERIMLIVFLLLFISLTYSLYKYEVKHIYLSDLLNNESCECLRTCSSYACTCYDLNERKRYYECNPLYPNGCYEVR